MVAGADGDTPFIEDGRHVMGVHIPDRKGQDAGRFLRPEEAQARMAGKPCAGDGNEGALMGVDRLYPHLFHPADCGGKADGADDVRRACLESLRGGRIAHGLEAHLVDHRAAALPGLHGIEDGGLCPQRADTGGAIELVA